MKKHIRIKISLIVFCFATLTFFIYNLFFPLAWTKEGVLIATSTSPQNTYTMNAYLGKRTDAGIDFTYTIHAYRNGAAKDPAILGVVVNNETGKSKNIY